jgi:DNA repair ATPase RecN
MSEIDLSVEQCEKLGILKCNACGCYPIREEDCHDIQYLVCDNKDCDEFGLLLSNYSQDFNESVEYWNRTQKSSNSKKEAESGLEAVLAGIATLLTQSELLKEQLDSIEKRVSRIETMMRS